MELTYKQLIDAANYYESIARKYRELAFELQQGAPLPDLFVQYDKAQSKFVDRRRAGSKQKRAIYEDLKLNGESTVHEIHQRTKVPVATIYFVLKDKSFRKKGKFYQLSKTPRTLADR